MYCSKLLQQNVRKEEKKKKFLPGLTSSFHICFLEEKFYMLLRKINFSLFSSQVNIGKENFCASNKMFISL